VILSAEKVCRLFRGSCSGLAAQITPLHNQHTYSANHKNSHFTPTPFIVPTLLFFYCREQQHQPERSDRLDGLVVVFLFFHKP
jgi:hypothetical protein